MELEYDKPINDYCGNCTKCIDACPTKAIVKSQVIDSRKCISYYTIEHKSEIPDEFKTKFKNWIFGCDICQDVCPWNNKKVIPTNEIQFEAFPEILQYAYNDWQNLTEKKCNEIFKESPILRIGYKGFRRNLEFIG